MSAFPRGWLLLAALSYCAPCELAARADDAGLCVAEPQTDEIETRLRPLAAGMQCALKTDTTADQLRALSAKAHGIRPQRFFFAPTDVSCSSVTYKFPEVNVPPGRALYFDVPERFRKRAVAFVIIGHRQDPNSPTNLGLTTDSYDPTPGYTSLQLHSADSEDVADWHYWGGPHSGPFGAKFAEVRPWAEIENLYEWRHLGHYNIATGKHSTSELHADAARMVSNGKDNVLMSQLTVKFQPPRADEYQSATFSPGTVLGDPETSAGRHYGGGQNHGGRFPDAVALNGTHPPGARVSLPKGWAMVNRELQIPVEPGYQLTSVDVACGDTHPDGLHNKDGGTGSLGAAKLSIELVRADGKSDTLMSHDNVPPEGVLTGLPKDCEYRTQPGDKIVIRADGDTAYVMGLRIGLKK